MLWALIRSALVSTHHMFHVEIRKLSIFEQTKIDNPKPSLQL